VQSFELMAVGGRGSGRFGDATVPIGLFAGWLCAVTTFGCFAAAFSFTAAGFTSTTGFTSTAAGCSTTATGFCSTAAARWRSMTSLHWIGKTISPDAVSPNGVQPLDDRSSFTETCAGAAPGFAVSVAWARAALLINEKRTANKRFIANLSINVLTDI
jgi:hypothetical protein